MVSSHMNNVSTCWYQTLMIRLSGSALYLHHKLSIPQKWQRVQFNKLTAWSSGRPWRVHWIQASFPENSRWAAGLHLRLWNSHREQGSGLKPSPYHLSVQSVSHDVPNRHSTEAEVSTCWHPGQVRYLRLIARLIPCWVVCESVSL